MSGSPISKSQNSYKHHIVKLIPEGTLFAIAMVRIVFRMNANMLNHDPSPISYVLCMHPHTNRTASTIFAQVRLDTMGCC